LILLGIIIAFYSSNSCQSKLAWILNN